MCFGYLPMLNFTGFSKQLHDSNNLYTLVINALKNARLTNDLIDSKIRFASRTDRGVGAINQVISLFTNQEPIIPEINSYLPETIKALGFTEVPASFHPRKDAILRTYSYFLCIGDELNLPAMRKTLNLLIGKHDFRNFAKNDPKKEKKTIKDIKTADIFTLDNNTYQIRVSSKSFLWQQVRRIVGHLIDVSSGKCDNQYTLRLLNSEPINFRPSPVPPQYLILEKVDYGSVKFDYDRKSLIKFRHTLLEQLLQARSNNGLYSFLDKYFINIKK
jgi:tRNA pseudouridine38-40 synthase